MRLDKQVTLQAKTTTYDSEGMPTEVWTANNTLIFANIQPNENKQYMSKQWGQTKLDYEFIIFVRPLSTISEGQRIIDGSDAYEIMKVKKWDAHYELLCSPV